VLEERLRQWEAKNQLLMEETRRHDERLNEVLLGYLDRKVIEEIKTDNRSFVASYQEILFKKPGLWPLDNPITPPSQERLTVHGLPFDDRFISTVGSASANADVNTGTFNFGISGNAGVTVGLMVNFQPTVETASLRVACYTQFHFAWLTASTFYVAHNRGSLGIFIWEVDPAGNASVVLEQFPPLWQDGTSWTQTHSDSQDVTTTLDGFFHAKVGHSYQVWFLCRASCDESDGPFGMSFAQATMDVRIPFVTFGST
jgi:hypothetical protein